MIEPTDVSMPTPEQPEGAQPEQEPAEYQIRSAILRGEWQRSSKAVFDLFSANPDAGAEVRALYARPAPAPAAAVPEPMELVRQYVDFCRLLPAGAPLPSPSLDPDGALSLDWSRGDDLVSVSIGADGHLDYATNVGGQRRIGYASADDELPEPLCEAIAALAAPTPPATAAPAEPATAAVPDERAAALQKIAALSTDGPAHLDRPTDFALRGYYRHRLADAIGIARAALAAPLPPAAGSGPSDEEIRALWLQTTNEALKEAAPKPVGFIRFARALLFRYGSGAQPAGQTEGGSNG